MAAPRRLIADRRIELAAGVGLFILGSMLLRDAYEGRNLPMPRLLRPFAWW